MSDTQPGEAVDHAKSSCSVHCTRTGLPAQLRQDYGVRLRAVSAIGGAPILSRLFEPAHDDFVHRYAQHVSQSRPQTLRLRRVRPYCDAPVGVRVRYGEDTDQSARAERTVVRNLSGSSCPPS